MYRPPNTAPFALHVPALRSDFKVLAFDGVEAISALYAIQIEWVSRRPDFDLESLLSQPAFMASFTPPKRLRYAHQVAQVAQVAYQQGFTSEQEITLYANVLGYLAGQPVADHADIVELLTVSTPQSPLKRLQRAAELAQSRAADLQGSRL